MILIGNGTTEHYKVMSKKTQDQVLIAKISE